MVLATVPAGPPTEKNQRATSWPAPISANVPYVFASRLSASAFCGVSVASSMVAYLQEWVGRKPFYPLITLRFCPEHSAEIRALIAPDAGLLVVVEVVLLHPQLLQVDVTLDVAQD